MRINGETTSLQWATEWRAIDGGLVCGDQFVVVPTDTDGTLIGVVDGLGHGAPARDAAEQAISAIRTHSESPLPLILDRCHASLRHGRGVVLSLVRVKEAMLTWTGVGNVQGLLLHADPAIRPPRDWLLLQGGVVGDRLPPPRFSSVSLSPGDLLVLATDGVKPGFSEIIDSHAHVDEIARTVLLERGRMTDDALVFVARYVGVSDRG